MSDHDHTTDLSNRGTLEEIWYAFTPWGGVTFERCLTPIHRLFFHASHWARGRPLAHPVPRACSFLYPRQASGKKEQARGFEGQRFTTLRGEDGNLH